ncbi:hypothetical protein D3C87_1991090 [compost metagenome]
MVPLGVSKLMPSMVSMRVSVSQSGAVSSALTTAMAEAMPPAVKKSGGVPKRFICSSTSQSFTALSGAS